MKLKSSTLQLSLIGCLSFLHLTSLAGPLSPTSNNNLSPLAASASTTKSTLRPNAQKESISNKLNPSVNFNELYSNVKSGKAATTKIEGGIAAGGGAIILYPDKHAGEIKAKAVEIYQITEGPAKSKFTLDTGPGQTLQEKIDYVLHRLSRVSGAHANKYRSWISDILYNPNETEDFNGLALPRVEDTGVVSMPGGGSLVQVFIQNFSGMLSFANKGKAEKRYLWNKKIFYSLDLDSQVALLFHEVIYRDYREINKDKNSNIAMNSEKVQYVVALILSKEVLKYGIKFELKDDPRADQSKSFYKLLKKLNLVSNLESECRTDGCVTNKNDQFRAVTEFLYSKNNDCVSNVSWIQSIKRTENERFEVICGDTYEKYKIELQVQMRADDFSIDVKQINITKTK